MLHQIPEKNMNRIATLFSFSRAVEAIDPREARNKLASQKIKSDLNAWPDNKVELLSGC